VRILALDTTTWWGGVALIESAPPPQAPRTVISLGAEVHDSHAAHLLDWIDAVLHSTGWTSSSLDGYVATAGPGSFTGVRVGLGTVRGLALASGRPAVGISTLDALAEAWGPAHVERVAVMSAGRGELYGARYAGGEPAAEPIDGPRLADPTRFLSRETERLLIPGPGSEDWLRGLAGEADTRVVSAPREIAAAAGRIALLRGLFRGQATDRLAPLYLRPPDAKLDPRFR